LLGPSGCGKTTLMRTLAGVQMVSAGQVRVLGLPAGNPGVRSRIGYSTQDPAIYTDLALAENLRYFGTVLGLPRSRLAEAIVRTESQAVQFMPAFVLPRALLCGIVVARAQMTDVLRWVSGLLPLSYAVDAMQQISTGTSWSGPVNRDVGVILVFTVGALTGGALTLRRRTR
jgi:ABC-2 type transport system ATP-binding protein